MGPRSGRDAMIVLEPRSHGQTVAGRKNALGSTLRKVTRTKWLERLTGKAADDRLSDVGIPTPNWGCRAAGN